jgi:hypothetical protein
MKIIALIVLLNLPNYCFSQEINFLRYKNFEDILFPFQDVLDNDKREIKFEGNMINKSYLKSETNVSSIFQEFFLKNEITTSDEHVIFYNGLLNEGNDYKSYIFSIERNVQNKFSRRGLLRLNVKDNYLCSAVYLFYESADSDLHYIEYTLIGNESSFKCLSDTYEGNEKVLENRYKINEFGFIEIIKFN